VNFEIVSKDDKWLLEGEGQILILGLLSKAIPVTGREGP
jgi:hypothetical protein